MGSDADSVLVEIITPTAKPSKKSTIVSTFQNIFDISAKAAIPGKVDPGLGMKAYNHVTTHNEQSGIFIYWKNMKHHDALAATPGFAEGGKLFVNDILPNIEGELKTDYWTTQQVDMALKDADATEVIELQLSGSKAGKELEKAVATAFEQLSPPQGFLGSFVGSKQEDAEKVVIVTKWSSKDFLDDATWAKESEKHLLSALGGKAQVERRLQMHS
ncbi:hypothetical protein H2200_009152 [Cladophialophora chaetospira]|uniref:ABM domain-containing protein n=1 Tax=Cladophialophora chaetospira TaxID=386627 RepID=A0AA39CFA5_9EURO|nr:hypothetical protein H2200_009152 [Cladophialophora chaetospira]